jgi:hypothetical protein
VPGSCLLRDRPESLSREMQRNAVKCREFQGAQSCAWGIPPVILADSLSCAGKYPASHCVSGQSGTRTYKPNGTCLVLAVQCPSHSPSGSMGDEIQAMSHCLFIKDGRASQDALQLGTFFNHLQHAEFAATDST